MIMSEFTIEPLKKILKNAGAKRVSDDSAEIFGEFLENYVKDIIISANKFSEHAGRRTVMREDMHAAIKIASK